MLVFLIIVSLILNVIALLTIVILYLRQNKLLRVEENQKKAMKEMEMLINSYLLEIKDENEHFIQRVKKAQNEKQEYSSIEFDEHPIKDTNKPTMFNEAERGLVREIDEISQQSLDLSSKLEKTVNLQAVKAYKQTQKKQEKVTPSLSESEEKRKSILEIKNAVTQDEKKKAKNSDALFQDSLLTQVMIMKKEGLSEKEMAKKLKKGKTEIELLLKFRQNQQE